MKAERLYGLFAAKAIGVECVNKAATMMAEFVKLMGVEEEAAYIATSTTRRRAPSRRLPRRRPGTDRRADADSDGHAGRRRRPGTD